MESSPPPATENSISVVGEQPVVDTELSQLNIADPLRANSSFMKVMATLFHYGNQAMNAAQLVIAVRALNLLPLRGETPKSTIQGIISTSRKIARDTKLPDPFRIDKDGTGRQAKYAIADEVINGAQVPEIKEIPDQPIILRPVHHGGGGGGGGYSSVYGKRQRRPPSLYTPAASKAKQRKRSKGSQKSRRKDATIESANSDIEIDSEEDFDFQAASNEEETPQPEVVEEDTIANYSLLYTPPTTDIDYIDPINFTEYPVASYFAIVQQKGYSYPRFRSHEKIKIPKVHCEDKFRVTDISKDGKVVGRLFILADGHGGPGCSEYFVRNTPSAIQSLCEKYNITELSNTAMQKQLEDDIKLVIQRLDDDYLSRKRQQIAEKKSEDDQVDNDGCTLILNIFLGEWMINVNVGDSRSVLISAPEPTSVPPTSVENANTYGVDNDYKMDVVFASQDHKPYLEHLARHILENGGEFVDSVQNRVIKVDLDKLKEDGNRQTKRVALKNARIRPKDYQAGLDRSSAAHSASNTANTTTSTTPNTESPSPAAVNWAAQSAVRTTVIDKEDISDTTSQLSLTPSQPAAPPPLTKHRIREDRIPSLNVARSCGDLDFKMDPERKIISCEPDITFIRISDQPYVDHTVLMNGPHREKRRHFLFMSTDGTFDYMYEETAERQNRAIAKVIGPMIEDGEKIGQYLLEEEERIQGQTIEHAKQSKEDGMEVDNSNSQAQENGTEQEVKSEEEEQKPMNNESAEDKVEANESPMDIDVPSNKPENSDEQSKIDSQPENESLEAETSNKDSPKDRKEDAQQNEKKEDDTKEAKVEQAESVAKDTDSKMEEASSDNKAEDDKAKETDGENKEEELPRIPLLHRELTEEEAKVRKVKERTLVYSARYFANREGAHGFFASTLQDYDDCTIILVEI